MKRVLVGAVVLAIALDVATAAMAQPGRGDRGRFGRGPGGGGNMSFLLMNPAVREELDLVDDQVAELREMGEELRDEMRNMFQGIRDLPEEERRDAIRERREEIGKLVQDRLKEVLLPEQLERLKQIQLRATLQQRGTAEAISQGPIAEALHLTDAQREKLREKSEKLNQELRAKIEELRTKMREELLGVLDSDQRAELDKLMGDDFDVGALGRNTFDRGPRDGRGGGPEARRGPGGPRGPEGRRGRDGFRGRRGRPDRPAQPEE